jgi:hypothetical protein
MITNRICRAVIISSFVLAGSLNAAPNAAGVDASKPITAKQWTLAGDGIGAWVICNWTDEGHRNHRNPDPTPELFDNLYSLGVRNVRLHMSKGNTPCSSVIDPETWELRPATVKRMSTFIDLATSRGITVMLQFGLGQSLEDLEGFDITEYEDKEVMGVAGHIKIRERVWEHASRIFKDKSYLLAMCPFIEPHLWQTVYPSTSGKGRARKNRGYLLEKEFPWLKGAKHGGEALNLLYDHFCRIFRKYNPKRIMGFKGNGVGGPKIPMYGKGGSPRHDLTMDDVKLPMIHMDYPYGDDTDTTYQIAVVPMSHNQKRFYDWNVNKHYTNEQIIKYSEIMPNAVARWRAQTGIEIYNDHGYWRKRKADGSKAESAREEGRVVPRFTLEQCIAGQVWDFLWHGKNRIPYTAIHATYLIPGTGKLVTEDTDPYAVFGIEDPVPTEGLSGKELKSAEKHNASIPKMKKEAEEWKENALAIIKAYREARRQLDAWKAAGGDPSKCE